MRMELPAPVLHSLFLINQAGFEAYVVGGCVRDRLMGKEPFDWDITTSALPEQILSVFRDHRTIETGIRHGTVTVIVEEMPLEITTYRVDGNYSDGRHPDKVSFTRSLKEDLRRRDFTVNAMAYHPRVGLADPFHGQKDLNKKIIRCVGTPKKRFSEDALRILRGLRFSSTLDFSIAPATARAIHRLGHTLSCVSAERISVELTKLLCGKNVEQVLCEYADVLSVVLPDVDFKQSSKLVSTMGADPLIRLAALMFELTSDKTKELCKRLRLSTHMTADIIALVGARNIPLEPTRRNVLHALHLLGPKLTSELLYLRTVADQRDRDGFRAVWDQLERNNDCCYQLKDLAVTGEHLMAAGVPAGPKIGATLNALLNAVMDGDCLNQKETLLEFATKNPVQ